MANRREFIKNALIGTGGMFLVEGLAPAAAIANRFAWFDETADPWLQVPTILRRIKAPVFPSRDFNITRFGADEDGRKDCTKAFRRAIDTCSAAGGGHVVVPRGQFLTGAIHLKSNVNLHLQPGATIKFSTNPKDYLPVVFTRWEGTELMHYSPFIYAFEQNNIAITGEGTLDGQGSPEHWWYWVGRPNYGWREGQPQQREDRDTLQQMAEKGIPVRQRVFGEGHYLRPQFIQPYACRNVLIDGVTIINSPMWEIHPVLCTNVIVRQVNIRSHGPNNDGCDPESCQDVLIQDCVFDTGDDCIAIKSGRNADGRRLHVPSQNIIVTGCRMKDGHGGITVGSEISGGVRNVFGENCHLDSPNLDHALRVKNNAMRGGLLEDLHFRNLTVGQVKHAVITIDFNYEEGERGSFIPVVRNFTVDHLRSGKSQHALDVQGFRQAPIMNVTLRDCIFDNVTEPSIVRNVQRLTLERVVVNGKPVEDFGQGR